MSKENIIRFLTVAKENKSLLLKVQSARNGDELSQLAKESGFEFTAAEFEEFLAESARIIMGQD